MRTLCTNDETGVVFDRLLSLFQMLIVIYVQVTGVDGLRKMDRVGEIKYMGNGALPKIIFIKKEIE